MENDSPKLITDYVAPTTPRDEIRGLELVARNRPVDIRGVSVVGVVVRDNQAQVTFAGVICEADTRGHSLCREQAARAHCRRINGRWYLVG